MPVASRTVPCSVTGPFGVELVTHCSEIGPREAVTWLATRRPFAYRENVFDVPLCPSTHMTAHAVPRTVVAGFGCVMATRSAPVDGGGGGGVLVTFDTVTEREVVPDPPSVSLTLSESACDP